MKWRCGDRIISAENPGRFCGWFFEILIWDGWNPLKPQPMGCLPLINGWLGFRWPIHSIRESIYQDPRVLTAIGPLVTDVRPWPHGLFHSFFWTSGSIFLGEISGNPICIWKRFGLCQDWKELRFKQPWNHMKSKGIVVCFLLFTLRKSDMAMETPEFIDDLPFF